MKIWRVILTIAIFLFSSSTYAGLGFVWNGFGTLGAGWVDDGDINQRNATRRNDYDDGLYFDIDTRIALQGSVIFTPSISVTAQVLAAGTNNYEPKFEWAYFTWDINKALKFRAGRMRRPNYLHSDYLNVGYAYPWIQPPAEVYSRDLSFFSEVDAINLFYQQALFGWSYSLEAYYGSTSSEVEINTREAAADYFTHSDFGLVFALEKDWLELRFAYQRLPQTTIDIGEITSVKLLFASLETAGFSQLSRALHVENIDIQYYSIAANIDYNNWLLSTEIIHTPIERSIVPEETSWYLMLGRRINAFTLHYTYADRNRNNKHNFSSPIRERAKQIEVFSPGGAAALSGLAAETDRVVKFLNTDQSSHTLGLRYEFKPNVALKMEYNNIQDNRNDLSSNLFRLAVDFYF